MATSTTPQKFTPCLWYDSNAEEAARFYCGLFPDSKVLAVQRAPADYPGGKKGQALVVEFSLSGQRFVGLNGGAYFKFNEAVSFMVDLSTQAEYDRLTSALSAVPEAEQCGWIKDRFGLSWQLVPRQLTELLGDTDPKVSQAVFHSMMDMKRIDIAEILRVGREARGASARTGKPAKAAAPAKRKGGQAAKAAAPARAKPGKAGTPGKAGKPAKGAVHKSPARPLAPGSRRTK